MADGESSKNSNGPTGLEDIVLRPDDDKVPIEIDQKTGRAKDPNKAKFVTFLGSLAQKEVSILTPRWKEVSKVQRNLIWEKICVSNLF